MQLNNWFNTTLKNRVNGYCDFDFQITPYKFTPKPFLESCKEQASTLSKSYDKLYVTYSGGLDSELVLKVFHEQNLPIIPILVETPYNQEEANWAKDFCNQRNIRLEILSYTSNQFIDELKKRTIDIGLPILLGGLPNIVADYVKDRSGYLLTGYGDPFSPNRNAPLEFSEWDYYLSVYDDYHPAAFFNYSLEVLYSMVKDIDYTVDLQTAKSKLYGLNIRHKAQWLPEYHNIQRHLTPRHGIQIRKYIDKDLFLKTIC